MRRAIAITTSSVLLFLLSSSPALAAGGTAGGNSYCGSTYTVMTGTRGAGTIMHTQSYLNVEYWFEWESSAVVTKYKSFGLTNATWAVGTTRDWEWGRGSCVN